MSGVLNGQVVGNIIDRLWAPTGELLNVNYSVIDAALLGNNTVVAAQAGKSIYVLSYEFVTAGAVTVEWQSGAGGTVLSKAQSLAANAVKQLPPSTFGWFSTAQGALLNLSLGAAVQVSGSIQWVAF